ncbi:MAG TPA: carbon starvation CstA family protein [Candidatus Pacearchaeota archaeon]|nr:carbon starvation CstA family protein [Candidatus Pacearchaeota archaeon]
MVNAIVILLVASVWLFLGYRIYGRFIEKRLKINDKNITPAVKQKDDIDYSPSKVAFLFGHHFESIAGSGPIIGPILAISYFGWLPVVLWLTLGSVIIGGVHDFTALMASVRNKAKGVASIAQEYLSSKAGTLFGIMIFVTLILIVTVFSVSAADSIIARPDLIIPLVVITVVAMIFGIGVQKFNWNSTITTIIAVVIVFVSIGISLQIPVTFTINPVLLRAIMITVIVAYAGIASVVPVWILLRPRDYLSSVQLLLILALGVLGIIIVNPEVNVPAVMNNGGFSLWPVLFISVACGAVSGFHALVSSGTTSKQLEKESHAKIVSYGGMLLEAFLAVIVTIVAVAGLKWGAGEGTFQFALNQGWIVLFSEGFGNIVGKVGIPFISIGVASLLGAVMVNQFVLTSVDTSTRLGRFIISEKFAKKFDFSGVKGRILATLAVVIPAWILGVTNSYETIWKLFASSNQLIAAIALITVAAYFLSKKVKVGFIILPAIFVLVTTMTALLYLTFRTGGYINTENWVLAVISLAMFALGALVAWEGFLKFRSQKNKK